MRIEIFLTIWFIAVVAYNMAAAIYRIVTEKDPETTWKEDAISSLATAVIYIAFLIWAYLSWWM